MTLQTPVAILQRRYELIEKEIEHEGTRRARAISDADAFVRSILELEAQRDLLEAAIKTLKAAGE